MIVIGKPGSAEIAHVYVLFSRKILLYWWDNNKYLERYPKEISLNYIVFSFG